uniref:DUF1758 domain-containing protein n=1 Tax=Caenorhabditis tropicalis TaxID=1561998 RepID=A0A1I7UI06_9PELO
MTQATTIVDKKSTTSRLLMKKVDSTLCRHDSLSTRVVSTLVDTGLESTFTDSTLVGTYLESRRVDSTLNCKRALLDSILEGNSNVIFERNLIVQ